MSRNNILLIAPALLLLAGAPRTASAQAAGWQTKVVGKSVVLTPPGLGAGEFYQITVYPRVPLKGAPLADFVGQFAGREIAALGKPVGGAEPPTATDHSAAVVVRGFVTPRGAGRVAVFTALSADGESARVIGAVSSPDVTPRYQPQFSAVLKEMWKQEKGAVLTSGRGPKAEKPPDSPQGMTPGGPVVPGIYAGGATFGGEFQESLRLYLYASGEYQMCDAGGKEVREGAGDFRYDPVTGLMDVGHKFALNNNKSRPDDGFCLYGRGADGKPYLHARETYVFKSRETVLRYVAPPTGPPHVSRRRPKKPPKPWRPATSMSSRRARASCPPRSPASSTTSRSRWPA